MADLLTAFGREIQGVAFLILRNQADAEEIVIDTMVTAWRKSGDLRDDNALRTWLLRIATRQALSRRRRQRPVQWIDLERTAAPSSTDPSFLDRVMLADAMSALPAQTRAAITLHHYAGLSVEEVAKVLGKSQNTVKSQLRAGLAQLRIALDAPAPADHKESRHVRRL